MIHAPAIASAQLLRLDCVADSTLVLRAGANHLEDAARRRPKSNLQLARLAFAHSRYAVA